MVQPGSAPKEDMRTDFQIIICFKSHCVPVVFQRSCQQLIVMFPGENNVNFDRMLRKSAKENTN